MPTSFVDHVARALWGGSERVDSDASRFVSAELEREPALRPEEIVGAAYERGIDAAGRRERGTHFTPRAITERVVARALAGLPADAPWTKLRVLDPAMGAGAFLCEALRQIVARSGLPDTARTRRRIAERCLYGVDKDPEVVHAARASLWLAIADPALHREALFANLAEGDSLFDPPPGPRTFDVVVGNPPFLGGKRIRTVHGDAYAAALTALHPPANGNTDLAAHFLRRAFDLLVDGGVVGFVVTNTISQGDTREGGLAEIVRRGGVIYGADRRFPWPGQAGVVTSLLWIKKGLPTGERLLDDRPVGSIDPLLSPLGRSADPSRLPEMRGRAFIGCFLRGKGFVFDDASAEATPFAALQEILDRRPASAEVVHPFLGGEEVLTDPEHRPHRRVIHFDQLGLEEARAAHPELVAIVERTVRPFREAKGSTKADLAHKAAWWRFANPRPELARATRGLDRVIVIPRMSSAVHAVMVPTGAVFSDQLVVVASSSHALLAVLSSVVHEAWAGLLCSTLGDGLRYTPSDVFETFPLPTATLGALEEQAEVERAGEAFAEARAACLRGRGIGLTRLAALLREGAAGDDLHRLGEAKAALDGAVLAAYGWRDVQVGPGGRLAEDAREGVLRRLFALNEARARGGG